MKLRLLIEFRQKVKRELPKVELETGIETETVERVKNAFLQKIWIPQPLMMRLRGA